MTSPPLPDTSPPTVRSFLHGELGLSGNVHNTVYALLRKLDRMIPGMYNEAQVDLE